MHADLPVELPVTDVDTRAALTEQLVALASTAERMVDNLDALRGGPLRRNADVDTEAALRVQLDQAAAAAADLRYSLGGALDLTK